MNAFGVLLWSLGGNAHEKVHFCVGCCSSFLPFENEASCHGDTIETEDGVKTSAGNW